MTPSIHVLVTTTILLGGVSLALNQDESPEAARPVVRIGSPRFRPGAEFTSLAYTPDGSLLISAVGTPTISLWEVETGRLRTRFVVPEGNATHVAVHPSGKHLAAWGGPVSMGRAVTLHDLEGKFIRKLGGEHVLDAGRFSPDGKTFAAARRSVLSFVDVETGGETGRVDLGQEYGNVSSLCWSPNGRTVALAGQQPLLVVDVMNRKAERLDPRQELRASQVEFTPDGRRLVLLSIFDSKLLVARFPGGAVEWEESERGGLERTIAVSPDGKTVASTGWGTTSLWSLDDRKKVGNLPERGEVVAFSPDGKTLAWGFGRLHLHRVGTREEVFPEPGHEGSVDALDFSSDGRRLASTGRDGSVRIWESRTGKLLRSIPYIHTPEGFAVAFQPRGELLASSGEDTQIRLWNSEGEPAPGKKLYNGGNPVFGLAFTPDGRSVVTRGLEETLYLHDLASGERRPLPGTSAGQPFAFSADGKDLLFYEGGKLVSYDVPSGKERMHVEVRVNPPEDASHPRGIVPSRDGRLVCLVLFGSNLVYIVETSSGRVVRAIPLKGTSASQARFTPDGDILILGDFDGRLRFWETASWSEALSVPAHESSIRSMALSRDGSFVATGGLDTNILIWDVRKTLASRGPGKLSFDAPNPLWEAFGRSDAAQAWPVIELLATSGNRATDFLKARIAEMDAVDLKALVEGLDHDEVQVREKAEALLLDIGFPAEEALRRGMKSGLSAEGKIRARAVLEKIASGPEASPGSLRRLRMISVLQRIGTPEARAMIESASRSPSEAIRRRAAAALGTSP